MAAPEHQDEYRAAAVAGLAWAVLLGSALWGLLGATLFHVPPYRVVTSLGLTLVAISTIALTRFAYVVAAAHVLVWGLLAGSLVIAYQTGGVESPALTGLAIPIVAAALLLDSRTVVAFGVVGAIAAYAMIELSQLGLGGPIDGDASGSVLTAVVSYLALATALSLYAASRIRAAAMDARASESLLERAVSQRLAAETNRSESERRYRTLVHNAHEMVFELDSQATILVAHGAEQLGFEAEELVGRSAAIMLHPDDRKNLPPDIGATIGEDGVRSGELRIRHSDGNYRWYEVTGSSYLAHDGQPRVLVMARDITQRIASRRELEHSENVYRTLVDHAPLGVITIDEDARITNANAACASLLGAPSVEAVISSQLFEPENMPAANAEQLANAGQRLEFELEWQTRWGRNVVLRIHAAPLFDVRGGYRGAQVILEDIAEQRRLETQLRESQKMDAVGRLAGGVAHDFNNYLTIILGWAEALLDKSDEGTMAHEAAEQVLLAAERSSGLTRQLLTFSRRHVADPQHIDPNALIGRIEPMLSRTGSSAIEFNRHPSEAISQVYADPALLEQVIVNLVVNAYDAMPDGGRLDISTSQRTVAAADTVHSPDASAGNYVRIEVSDTGAGMDAETRARLFEPFFTTKAEGQGTGLGLSTAYGIVRQMGGWIEVRSQVGRGSSFSIYLPHADGVPLEKTTAVDAPPAGGSERILVVEDEQRVRDLVRNTLTERGYSVIEAANGEAALREIERDARIDLVLSDVAMPVMGGLELATQLRRAHPGLRILFMSGYAEERDVLAQQRDAGIGLLEKPFTARDLLTCIRKSLDGEAPRGS